MPNFRDSFTAREVCEGMLSQINVPRAVHYQVVGDPQVLSEAIERSCGGVQLSLVGRKTLLNRHAQAFVFVVGVRLRPDSGRLTSGSRPGQAVPSPFCQRSKNEGKLRPNFTKCKKINIFEHAPGFRPPVAMANQNGGKFCIVKQCLAMSPLRKGSRCHAPALCLSQ